MTTNQQSASGPSGAAGDVVRAAIHPAIGVARVGDSAEGFFVGPETLRPDYPASGTFKDTSGALKRQAARFRVYGLDASGAVVTELTAANAEIAWTVRLANLKAAWYQFQIALDLPPDVLAHTTKPSARRNATVHGGGRAGLAITPSPRTVTGRNVSGPGYRFDTGQFLGQAVSLGEVRTDDAGRLLVLGGHGVSGSPTGAPLTTFANNDGWFDDTSDGPVTAVVKVGGRSVPVDPAWVVVAPPDYAPGLSSVRSMYDLMQDMFVTAGMLPAPPTVSFADDVLPVLRRLAGLAWVNAGFAAQFGAGGPWDLESPELLGRLGSKAARNAELRRQVFLSFRNVTPIKPPAGGDPMDPVYLWGRDGPSPMPWPWIYGDSMTGGVPHYRLQHSVVTDLQLAMLKRWADGDFDETVPASPAEPARLDDLPVAERPGMLDRAALTYCLADAFHPGCEMTWPVRHVSMFSAPFRIAHRPDGVPEPDYGDVLTPARALGAFGPLHAQAAGGLSRWMAVPWQADTASCRSGYDPGYDTYLPSFWPAKVPNQVLTRKDYDVVVDTRRPMGERQAAFANRAQWLRVLPQDQAMDAVVSLASVLQAMVKDFGRMGIVEPLPGPVDGAFPATLLVESELGLSEEGVPPDRGALMVHVPEAVAGAPEAQVLGAPAVLEALSAEGVEPYQITAGMVDRGRWDRE